MAERNVERWRETGKIDLAYLGGLSADALPALLQLLPGMRAATTVAISAWVDLTDGWGSANRSRSRARRLLRS